MSLPLVLLLTWAGLGAGCPAVCRCEGFRRLRRVDCMNLGLRSVPSNLSSSTASLHLDANFLSRLPASSFKGLSSLRFLWLADNFLKKVPVLALSHLPALQALTLAVNKISYVPDGAFVGLQQLLVLHLHDNRIQTLSRRSFTGLTNLETLDMSFNRINVYPTAVRHLRNLRELNLQNNNISVLPEDAFTGNPSIQMMNIQNNPLHTLDRSSVQLQPGLNPPYVEIVLITSTTPGDTPAEEVQVHAVIQIRNVSMTHSDVTRVSISALSSNRLSLRHRLEASGSGPLTCTDPSASSPPAEPPACLDLSLWLHITVSFIFIISTLLIPSWRQSVVAALFLRVQPAD